MRKILWELSQIGFNAEWDVIPASSVGSPQLRERVFIVAYPKSNNQGCDQIIDIFSKIRANLAKHRGSSSKVTWNGIEIDRKDQASYTRLFPQPIFSRVDNGFPNWLERLKPPGNAVVPQVVEFIGRAIMDAQPGGKG